MAQDRLMEVLGKLASDVNVISDANVEFVEIPTIPANPTIYIYLAPHDEGIKADFFVCPLGTDAYCHRPGVGSERLLGKDNGKNVQTYRNLYSCTVQIKKKENERLQYRAASRLDIPSTKRAWRILVQSSMSLNIGLRSGEIRKDFQEKLPENIPKSRQIWVKPALRFSTAANTRFVGVDKAVAIFVESLEKHHPI